MTKRIVSIVLFIFSVVTATAQYDTNSFAQYEPDLSHINSIKDAEDYYSECHHVVFKEQITQKDISDAANKLFWLARKLGMEFEAFEGLKFGQKYRSYLTSIKAHNQEEVHKIELLMIKITYSYNFLNKLFIRGNNSLDYNFWRCFSSDNLIFSHLTNGFGDNILSCEEYNLGGIVFAVFINRDKNFAYDITLYHKTKKYNKKTRKNYYETLKRSITIMPNNVYFISSTISLEKIYFKPTAYEITNKYYVGNK